MKNISFTVSARVPKSRESLDIRVLANAIQTELASQNFGFFSNPIVFDIWPSEPMPVVQYPPVDPNDIDMVEIVFDGPISKDRVENIIKYWGSLPFVGEYERTDWVNGKARIYVNVNKSASHNPQGRRILELLAEYLTEGTPLRKTDGARAFNGLGDVVEYVTGMR